MFKNRIKVIIIFFCIIFAGLLYRLFSLQVIYSKSLTARRENRLHRIEQIAPRRGTICDKNGVVMAEDTSSFDLWISPCLWDRNRKSNSPILLFDFIPYARAEALLNMSGAHREYEKKLLISFIMRKSVLTSKLETILNTPKKILAEKLLGVALEAVEDKSAGTIYYPRIFIKNIDRKSYLKIISDNYLYGDESDFKLLSPKIGWKRRYPFGKYASHILGYVSPLNSREYEKMRGKWGRDGIIEGQGYIKDFFYPTETEKYIMRLYEYNRNGKTYRASGHLTNDLVGRTGIEQEYNNLLRGSHGLQRLKLTRPKKEGPRILEVIEVDAEVQSGQNIQLTINSKVQQETFSILESSLADLEKERKKKFAGACILMNPNNGEIEAMVSLPSYNPDEVSKRYKEYTSPEAMKPFLNRTISEIYPPGSTFKPIVATAALSAGVITPETEFDCQGLINLGGHDFICMRRYSHGPIDVYHSIRLSCNVFFYETGRALGHRRLYDFATDMGLGKKTGIDLPNESAGIIPEAARTGYHWATGNTFHMSIGQGIAVTPLQMAVAVSAIANGGKIVKPHILSLTGKGKEEMDSPLRTLDIPQKALDTVRKAMWGVVNDRGTGRRCHFDSMEISGKSGSADWKRGEPTHAWFVAYAPSNNPQLVVIVLVPKGDLGGSTCAPIARKIFKMYFNLPDEKNAVG